jgi:hypothetical protein
MHMLDANLVKLAAAIQQTSACSLWAKRLTDLRVTKIERRVQVSWLFRQTRWHTELESSEGWKATMPSTKVLDAVDVNEFVRGLAGTGMDVREFDDRDIRRALHTALGDALRVAQDRIDTAACDAPCIEERGGAR